MTGPYDQGGPRPTITFEYHPDAAVPWALTRHLDLFRDPSGNATIDTVLFSDGLKRTIQTKNSASIFTSPASPGGASGMIVSGHATYDFVVRVIEQFYPVTEWSAFPESRLQLRQRWQCSGPEQQYVSAAALRIRRTNESDLQL